MVIFKEPVKKHRPVAILIDRSKSVETDNGRVMEGINRSAIEAVKKMKEQVLYREMTDMLVIQFDTNPEVMADFVRLNDLDARAVTIAQAKGCTDTGKALLLALEMLDQKKKECKELGEEYVQPLLFLITDGAPDPGKPMYESQREAHARAVLEYEARYQQAAAMIRQMEAEDKLVFVAGGISVNEEIAADIEKLRELTRHPERVIELDCGGDLSSLEEFFEIILLATEVPLDRSPISALVGRIAQGKRYDG